MNVTEAVENYLEAILVLSEQGNDVRAIDICTHMGHARPTVSVAVKSMKGRGLISVDAHNRIRLTAEGYRIANAILERHTVLTKALIHMGVDAKTAYEDACKMEHDISEHTFSCIKNFMKQQEKAPDSG